MYSEVKRDKYLTPKRCSTSELLQQFTRTVRDRLIAFQFVHIFRQFSSSTSHVLVHSAQFKCCHQYNELFHHKTRKLDRNHFSLLQLFQNIFLRLVRYTQI